MEFQRFVCFYTKNYLNSNLNLLLFVKRLFVCAKIIKLDKCQKYFNNDCHFNDTVASIFWSNYIYQVFSYFVCLLFTIDIYEPKLIKTHY